MRIDRLRTLFLREYLTRVRSKGFWITTLLLPLAMAALVVLPSLVLLKTRGNHRMAVVDAVGGLGEKLAAELAAPPPEANGAADRLNRDSDEQIAKFDVEIVASAGDPETQRAALDQQVLAGEIDSWIWLSPAAVEAGRVEYHAESVSNFLTQKRLERALSIVFARLRLGAEGYDAERVVELTRDVDLTTLKVSETGTTEEEGMAGFLLAYLLFFLLYSVVAIYGSLVMNGVLEEKSSRIVEVLLATTTPKELMTGKLLGIGCAGLTQLAVWSLAIGLLTAPGLLAALAIGTALPHVAPSVLIHFLLHFVLGFFLFSSLYAAIGAATNSAQEAQQLSVLVIPFLVAPVIFMVTVINDPSSTLATVLSLIPPFTPLLMLLRIVVKSPPAWQIALGYLLTTGFVLGMLSLCARIYRVGILMYGKRPTFTELGRWIRRA